MPAGYGAKVLTGRGGPTSDMHIRYLGAATEGSVLRAESRVQRAGRTLIVMDVRVTDQDGRLVAVGDLALAPAPSDPTNCNRRHQTSDIARFADASLHGWFRTIR